MTKQFSCKTCDFPMVVDEDLLVMRLFDFVNQLDAQFRQLLSVTVYKDDEQLEYFHNMRECNLFALIDFWAESGATDIIIRARCPGYEEEG